MTRRLAGVLMLVLALAAIAFGASRLLGLPAPPLPVSAEATPVPIFTPEPAAHATPTAIPTPTPVPHDNLRIKLPELGIDLPIVEGDGYNAPLYVAAHYPGLGWPGEGRRSIIYAHARPGMFGPLFGAHVGQHVEIDRPNAAPLRYTISSYNNHWPINDESILKPQDGEQLVLITCTTYNYSDPRIVAVATPDSSG